MARRLQIKDQSIKGDKLAHSVNFVLIKQALLTFGICGLYICKK